jgi:hypothetical protein
MEEIINQDVNEEVTAIKLDVPIARIWRKIKDATTVEGVLQYLADEAVQSESQYSFFQIAINRAIDSLEEDKDRFIQTVEKELALFFPDTSPEIPADLEALIFLLYVTKYATLQQAGDMTLIDQYFDLTIDIVNAALEDEDGDFVSKLKKICGPQAKLKVANLADSDDFNREKWTLLYNVLDLEIEGTTGAKLLDVALEALDNDDNATIINAIATIRKAFPEREVTIPAALEALVQSLTESPHDLENILYLLQGIDTESEAGAITTEYLTQWLQALPNYDGYLATFSENVSNVWGDAAGDIEDLVIGCSAYLYTDYVLARLKDIYPDLEIPCIMDWEASNIELWDWLAGTTDNISYEDVFEAGYTVPLTYILVKLGGKNPLRSFNGRLRGLRKSKETAKFVDGLKRTISPTPSGNKKGGKKKGGKKKNSTPLLHTSICHALLMRKFRFQALNHMMCREVHFMDPVIGDTLCELRPAFLVACDDIIQASLTTFENWENLVQLYNANHSNCPLDESVINNNPLLLLGYGPDPDNYIMLCHTLEDNLAADINNDAPHYLTLCKALTRSTLLVRDSLGIEGGESTTGIVAGKETKRRREEMATYCTDFSRNTMTEIAQRLAGQAPGFIKTAEVLQSCNVQVTDKGTNMPLLPIYQSQMLSLAQAMDRGRPVIVRLQRIHIIGVGDMRAFENASYREATYEVAEATVLVYQPNRDTGRFEYVEDPEDDLLHMPGVAISAYSMLDLTGTTNPTEDAGYGTFVDGGYYNPDVDEFMTFIKTQDIVNLLNACSANHPVFVHNARSFDSGSGKFSDIVDQFSYICALYDREKSSLEGQNTINLGSGCTIYVNDAFDDFASFYKLGEALQLDRRQYKETSISVGQNTVVVRRLGNMPFYSTHIYCSTLATELVRAANFHVNGNVDRFETKEDMINRCIIYFLNELENARSMQFEQTD